MTLFLETPGSPRNDIFEHLLRIVNNPGDYDKQTVIEANKALDDEIGEAKGKRTMKPILVKYTGKIPTQVNNIKIHYNRDRAVWQLIAPDKVVIDEFTGGWGKAVEFAKTITDYLTRENRWVVTEYTPGYLPDNAPAICDNLKEAGDYALTLKRELEEAGYTVSGTRRDGYTAERSSTDLGRVIEIREFEKGLDDDYAI